MSATRRFLLFAAFLCLCVGSFFLGRLSALPCETAFSALQPLAVSPAPVAQAPLDGRIDLNTAALSDLCLLPGIGEALAGRILSYRETNGSFSSVDELAAVSGIGDATVARLRPYITVK